jgi:hypothetical protein
VIKAPVKGDSVSLRRACAPPGSAKDAAAAAEVLSIWRRSIMAWFRIFPGTLPWRRRSSQDIEARTHRVAIKRFFRAQPSAAFLRDQPLVIACPVWVQEAQLRRAMVHEAATKLPAEYIN